MEEEEDWHAHGHSLIGVLRICSNYLPSAYQAPRVYSRRGASHRYQEEKCGARDVCSLYGRRSFDEAKVQ